MAGVGDAWGTAEELLHPRDSHGRFRSSWKMSGAAVKRTLDALSSFNPKTFPSDDEAQNYLETAFRSRPSRNQRSIDKLIHGYSDINKKLRAGDSSDVADIDAALQPLPDSIIVSRIVGPEAFGLKPETVANLEEYTGKLVSDRGYSSTSIGTPLGKQPGQITMAIAIPAGAKVGLPGKRSREVILDREQPLRITKVTPDGQGGFHIMAVAMEKGSVGNKRTKKLGTRAPKVTQPDQVDAPQVPGPPVQTPQVQAPIQEGQVLPVKKQGRPAGPPPPPRTDGHVAENLGGQGKTTTQTPEPEVAGPPPGRPRVPVEEQPRVPKPEDQQITERTEGTRKRADENAVKVRTGEREIPEQTDEVAKLQRARATRRAYAEVGQAVMEATAAKTSDTELADRIDAIAKSHLDRVHPEASGMMISDLGRIADDFRHDRPTQGRRKLANFLGDLDLDVGGGQLRPRDGVGKVVRFDPEIHTGHSGLEKGDKVRILTPDVQWQRNRGKDREVLEKATVEPESGPRVPTKTVPKKKAPVTKAAEPKAPEKAQTPEVAEPKKPGIREGKTNISRVRDGDVIMGAQDANGNWIASPARTKGTPIKVTGRHQVKVAGSGRPYTVIEGVDQKGNKVEFKPGPAIQTFWTPAPPKDAKKVAPKPEKTITTAAQETHDPAKLQGPSYTIDILRNIADERGITIPRTIKTRNEIRDFILNIDKEPFDSETLVGRGASLARLKKIAKDEGIFTPQRIVTMSADDLRIHILEQRQIPKSKRVSTLDYAPGKVFSPNLKNFVRSPYLRHQGERWVDFVREDTPPNRPLRVENVTIANYTIKHGVIHRIDGVSYLVETGEVPSPDMIASTVDGLRNWQATLPKGAERYQQGIAWLRGVDPNDEEAKIRYKNPRHVTLASAGDGTIHVFGRRSTSDVNQVKATLTHEYGHNVDFFDNLSISDTRDWSLAGADIGEVTQFTPLANQMHQHPISLTSDPSRPYPYGVTMYGKSSKAEDFAESMRLYQAGVIGSGQVKPVKTIRPLYFRDLFPGRAKILDEIYPEIARQQKAAILKQIQDLRR